MAASNHPEAWIESSLSAPRFQKYLDAVGGDRAVALDLYDWNAEAAAAVVHDLAHLEVALRNAYDRALSRADRLMH
ncbi:hypothetical protein [Phytoactinopolyspora halotolerans]|uniref:hypothetical protein n=1 Tax=Phytoactinopolyspora halotolerans TaxID=1981512 RepID=UPI001C2059D1|nr:hypothetical protein [Phytoactinopolyspora halotolerans]